MTRHFSLMCLNIKSKQERHLYILRSEAPLSTCLSSLTKSHSFILNLTAIQLYLSFNIQNNNYYTNFLCIVKNLSMVNLFMLNAFYDYSFSLKCQTVEFFTFSCASIFLFHCLSNCIWSVRFFPYLSITWV